MRLITRCPFCRTLFKVAPDQLLISEGWVRCGQCREAFDASLQLLPPQAAQTTTPRSVESVDAVGMTLEEPDISAKTSGASFESAQRRRFFLQMPGAQSRLLFLAPVFLFALLGQIIIQERDRIAAFNPVLKPWLVSLCIPFQCKIASLRLVDSISIESSTLTRLQGDVYRINLVVKNIGSVEVATPAIELTLTNSLDKPLLRRVLRAEQFSRQATLGAAVELPATFVFSMKPTEVNERMTGYRLIAFYP